MSVKENISVKFEICKSGDLLLTRRSERRYAERGRGEKQNIDELKSLMYQKIREIHVQRFPYNDFLYQNYEEDCV